MDGDLSAGYTSPIGMSIIWNLGWGGTTASNEGNNKVLLMHKEAKGENRTCSGSSRRFVKDFKHSNTSLLKSFVFFLPLILSSL